MTVIPSNKTEKAEIKAISPEVTADILAAVQSMREMQMQMHSAPERQAPLKTPPKLKNGDEIDVPSR